MKRTDNEWANVSKLPFLTGAQGVCLSVRLLANFERQSEP